MNQLSKEATLTGRVASLARHPLNAASRKKLERRVSEKLVKKVNQPLYKALLKKKIPLTKKPFAGHVGDAAGWLGVMGEPGEVGPLKKKLMGRMAARAMADNPELIPGYMAPVPYLGSALALGKKRVYKFLGARTPEQVRKEMEKRTRRKVMGTGAGVAGASVLALRNKKPMTAKQKAKADMDDRLVGLGRELQRIAKAKR